MASKLSALQRAMNFNQATRQYEQVLPSVQLSANGTASFSLPKTRFLQKITLMVKGTYKASNASSTSLVEKVLGRYNWLKRIRMSINNGFNPYDISGFGLRMYNLVNNGSYPDADAFNLERLGLTTSASGTTNYVNYALDMPITVNDRDPIGLIMLQNEQTIVNVDLSFGTYSDVFTSTSLSGTTISDVSITITPIVTTFSIPNNDDYVPDYSMLKCVHEQSEAIINTSEMTIKMPVGLTYRKFLLYLASDTDMTAISHSYLNYFQLVFNQADIPYNVSADYQAYKNKMAYDGVLPAGVYCFDFSNQGIPNQGGSRDYVDTEALQEFWTKIGFTGLTGTNYVFTIKEMLAKLK